MSRAEGDPPPLLDIHRATVWRGNKRVFGNLSLRIAQGENVAILGPNGAGKTTLLRLLTRELYPVSQPGSWLRILGHDSWNVWDLRRHLGIVSHDLHRDYSPGVRARNVVLSGYTNSVGLRGIAHELTAAEHGRAEALLQSLGIADLADTPFSKMSTGQQRRCLLARALVASPGALVLDEPMAALDINAAFAFQVTLRRLMADGVAVIIVTHHVNDIPPAVERVVLLDKGRIAGDGPKHRLLTSTRLSALYQTPVRVVKAGGYFLAAPG